MKTFIFFLISFSAMASNWMPLSQIESQGVQGYSLESSCEAQGEQCLDVDPVAVKAGFVSLDDDWSGKQEVQQCEGQSACQEILLSKVCPSGSQSFANESWSEVYCTKLEGKKAVLDSAGYSAHVAAESAKAALAAAKGAAKAIRECGLGVMDLMLVRNQSKGLTTSQVKQLVASYAGIKGLLESGSLVSAKEEIQAVAADGLLVTEGDKSALVAEINKCLGI